KSEGETKAAATGDTEDSEGEEQPAATGRTARALAELVRKEEKVRKREAALKQREARIAQSEELVQLLRTNPLAAIEKAGIPIDDFINAAMQNPQPSAADAQQRRIDELERRLSQ